MIQDDLAAIKAALDAGPTPGPWFVTLQSRHVFSKAKVTDDEDTWQPLIAACDDDEPVNYEANAQHIAACSPDRIARLVAHVEAEQGHVYRLREQIGRDTDTIFTLRGLLALAREALADCLDDAPTADKLSVSGGVYEGVAVKNAIRAIDAALESKE